ncbi:MAG: TIGR02147 family protein [Pseudomonadota bacterium]|nr:TIGR02147 family protein [Pseudomonadota bacterium]
MKPVVYDFQDYRVFLKDLFAFEKSQDEKFSHRVFAQRAGFSTPNFLLLIINGKRNLTAPSIKLIAKGFGLNEEDTLFFKTLVFLNQASEPSEKNRFAKELSKSKVFKTLRPLKAAELDFYQNWYNIPIRELIGHPNFRNDPTWIAKVLRNKITPRQAASAIASILELGFAVKDKNGKLTLRDQNITTGNEITGSALVSFHKKMLDLAKEAIDDIPKPKREISSSTLFLSEDESNRLKQLVQEFRQSLLREVHPIPGNSAYSIYQFNFQVFPISEKIEEVPCKSNAK